MMSEFLKKEFQKRFYKMCDLPAYSAPIFFPLPPTTISLLITGACKKAGRGGKIIMMSPSRMLAIRNAADAAKELKVSRRHGNQLIVDGVRVVFEWHKHSGILGKQSPVIIDEYEPNIKEE